MLRTTFSGETRVATALGWLVGVVQAAARWIISATPRARLAGRAVRRRTAAGLHRVADFTRKQAGRVAPDTRNECLSLGPARASSGRGTFGRLLTGSADRPRSN